MSQWVSQWVCLYFCHKISWTLYKSQHFSDVSQTGHQGRCGYSLFLVKIRNIYIQQTGSELISPLLIWKMALMSDISKMVTYTMLDSTDKEIYSCAINNGTTTFDLGWRWNVLNLGHMIFASYVSSIVQGTILDSNSLISIHLWWPCTVVVLVCTSNISKTVRYTMLDSIENR